MRNQDNYIYNQLIPYIGNKRKLIPLISQAIKKTGIKKGIFFDVFAGTGVVSRLAKTLGYKVIANDWEPFSYVINQVYIEQNRPPVFEKLGGLKKTINILNNLKMKKGYIATFYCPEDDEKPDPKHERMFYTQENGRRIDTMRGKIGEWRENKLINENEKNTLLAPLIFQGAYCSNTSGVFKGFHYGWGGRTHTALYRIQSILTLEPPLLFNNKKKNKVYKEDSNKLVRRIKCNIAYIDPPYNQHQYGSNYHLLNTIALWDKPKINKDIIVSNKKTNKSAIRTDWRTERHSLYCYKDKAVGAFLDLITDIQADYILVSYSTDGIIDFDRMLKILAGRGELSVVTQKYKRYRVSSQRYSEQGYNVEFVIIVNTNNGSNIRNIKKVKQEINDQLKAIS